jgi:GT2 family glycosyltransferase
VPTFRRRDMLTRTLASLAEQQTVVPYEVIVVDNDAVISEGMAVAASAFAGGRLAGTALLEPRQGNCHAINAALRAALRREGDVRYVMMIDDDEIADPAWLQTLVGAAERHGADIVGGPVHPMFPPGTPRAIATHPVFQPAYTASGAVPMIYGSGNFLIRRDALSRLAQPCFDIRFNFLGGGDTDFFRRCRQAGLISWWADGARIAEEVPASRIATAWILRRGLRIGAINSLLDRRGTSNWAGRARVEVKTAMIIALSLWRAMRSIAAGRGLLQAAHPVAIAMGRLLASLGVETEQYRAGPRR